MKRTYATLALSIALILNFNALAAPICGSWNNYENCINPPNHLYGVDQGTVAKQHYDSFRNYIEPNFVKYREAHQKSNADIQKNITDELNKINDYFIRYAKGIFSWKIHSPGSFYDYFNTNDEHQVLRDQWEKFDNIITDLYQETYNRYLDIYLKLNQKIVGRIEYYYYAKAYDPAISGVWGFQQQYNYGYSYHMLEGLGFIHEGGNNSSVTALTFSDRWNNANTHPTTITTEREIYVEVNQADMNDKINHVAYEFLNVTSDETTDYKTQLAYVIEFDSKLLRILTLDSLKDKRTKHFLYSLAYVDHISKEDLFNDAFYMTKHYAESNAISLVYAYATNRKDYDYISQLTKTLERVKKKSWYDEANELYKNIIEGILQGSDSPISIALSYQYINYIIDSNKMELKGWRGLVNQGNMRSYVNPYSGNQLEVMKARFTADFATHNQYFPINQESDNEWEFVGVIFNINQYRNFISSVDYTEWGNNTFPGDIHKTNGMYFSPKFSGNPLNDNRGYPTEPRSNDYWFYIGNDDKPDDGLYSYIIYTRFYHDLYSQMIKLWLLNIQNGNADYVDISLPYQQTSKINKILVTLLRNSQKEWRYAGYAMLDSSLVINAEIDFRLRIQLANDFFRMMDERAIDLIEHYNTYNNNTDNNIPHYSEVVEKWSNGEWDPPEEFTESWYPRVADIYDHDINTIKQFLDDANQAILHHNDELLVSSFSNSELVNLINAMAITSNLTISTTSLTTITVLASIFGVL